MASRTSRRIERADGRFEGVVTASLDSRYLTRIYNSVNIGEKGYIQSSVSMESSAPRVATRCTSSARIFRAPICSPAYRQHGQGGTTPEVA